MDEATSAGTSPSLNEEEVPKVEAPLWQVKAHLLKISNKDIRARVKVAPNHRLEMQRMHDQVENDKLERKRRSQILLPPPLPSHGPIPSFWRQEGSNSTDLVDGKRRKVTTNSHLLRAFQNNARHELDSRIARMFYTGGLQFYFTRNLNYRSSYSYATTHNIPGYVPPGYNALRTTLLQKERANIERLLKLIKNYWLANDVNIVSDGWVLKNAIKDIGHEKVVQVITDNVSVMKSAGALIEGRMMFFKAQKVKDMVLSNRWWDVVDYILEFTTPIYDMLRAADTDRPCLHLVYEMWDSMIENVKDHEISIERSKCLERYFEDENELRVVKVEFTAFSRGRLPSPDDLTDRWALQPLVWWYYHGSSLPMLQTLALKLIGQPFLSSYVERNWSTYKFLHSLKRNKMALAHAEDLVYVHSNLQLLSRRNKEYINAATKMCDIVGDSGNDNDIHGRARILENANLTLDELELEAMVIGNA
ncbi:uncharacterized protein LOC142634814 [Castanea sativa]|uniref:uncharacterized protein LOC142634814 n=1 Tax=Castanea sativa TaxID=21020 RepID=UPI003F6493D5